LENADRKAGRDRDALLATGLPRKGNMASWDRFAAQTIARTTRAGGVYPGALTQFSLGVVEGGRVALTEAGVKFSSLDSPVLDGDLEAAEATFSTEERRFLVEHIAAFVPGELSDFRGVLRALGTGKVTPDTVIGALRPSLPPTWTDQVVRTHVAGVIGRMAELDLVHRQWEGRRVRYHLGPIASEIDLMH
jgi:hypothetical protein